VICLDELGPTDPQRVPGRRLIRPDSTGMRRVRARQELTYHYFSGGYIFGAFVPATGAVFTAPYRARNAANWVAFLDQVEAWLDPAIPRVYAVLDNLPAHRAVDVLLWAWAHPRWEFVFQPTRAAYLNLIEPWWKILRSLTFPGRQFTTWEHVCQAVAAATDYWNAHRHPFHWGRRPRRRPARAAGIACLPTVA
jgi:hypothetical protein